MNEKDLRDSLLEIKAPLRKNLYGAVPVNSALIDN